MQLSWKETLILLRVNLGNIDIFQTILKFESSWWATQSEFSGSSFEKFTFKVFPLISGCSIEKTNTHWTTSIGNTNYFDYTCI